MAFTPYATVAEFKAWVDTSDALDDAQAARILIAVTEWIDEFCQRHFWQDTAVARVFAVGNVYCLNLGPFNDLVSVTTLKTDEAGDGTFETTWSASDYQLLPENRPTGRPYTKIESVAGRLFPYRCGYGSTGRRARVEVTGTWGWPAVPDAVKQACLIQANYELGRRNSPQGVIGGAADFTAIRVSNRTDPGVIELLDPYVHRDTAVMIG